MATASEDQDPQTPTLYYHALTPQDALVYRLVRLRALSESPEEYSSNFERELGYPLSIWEKRLRNTRARTFVATSLANLDGSEATLNSDTWNTPSQFTPSDTVHYGTVTCMQSFEDPLDASIFGFWVSPGSRGRKVGRTLLEKALEWAREQVHSEKPFRSVVLYTKKENTSARRVYELSGFSPAGTAMNDAGWLRYILVL